MPLSNLDKLVSTKYGWHVDFNKEFNSTWRPFGRPRFKQLVEYIPLFMRLVRWNENKNQEEYCLKFNRYLRIWYKLKRAKRRAHMDFINPVPLQQIYGKDIKCFIV